MANELNGEIGLFLFKLKINDPTNIEFIIKHHNKFLNDDCDLEILNIEGQLYEELIVSYKTIYINTYNIVSVDLGLNRVVYRHESFQLWESESKGIFISKNKDFLKLNKYGLQVMSLGGKEKRKLYDHYNNLKVLISLDSYDYLKLEQDNHILFDGTREDYETITINQEFRNPKDIDDATFVDLYKIKV